MKIMHELEITAEITEQFGEEAANNFAELLGSIGDGFDPEICPHRHLRYTINTINDCLRIIGSRLRIETVTWIGEKGYYFEVYTTNEI